MRLRRVGDTQALTQAVFELEWLQPQVRDAAHADVVCRVWENKALPYAIAIPDDAELRCGSAPQVMVVDDKSVFDTLLKPTAGSKHDRRTAINLALLRQVVEAAHAVVRWIPYPFMPANIMTKSDVGRGDAALTCMLRSGSSPAKSRRSARDGPARPSPAGRVSERLLRQELD